MKNRYSLFELLATPISILMFIVASIINFEFGDNVFIFILSLIVIVFSAIGSFFYIGTRRF